MKQAVFILNILLAIAVLGMTTFNIVKKEDPAQEYSVKKSSKKAAAAKPQTNYSIRTGADSQESTIVSKNLFNPERNPNAQGGGGSGQMQLTLVGVTMIGNWKGAIILQKTSNRQFRPFGFPMPGQQRQPNQPQAALQQYVRVGERLPNGYVLTEVTRTGAVLTLNGNRMELKLQEASKNQPQAAPRQRRTNSTTNMLQQMQQMQRMQMMQQMQMMRMMRQGGAQPGAAQPGGNRGGQSGAPPQQFRRR